MQISDCGLRIADCGAGRIVIRPTVTGVNPSCERRAQSSSGTSTGDPENDAARARCARSRSAVVRKNARNPPSRSSRAVGEKSSSAAYTRSRFECWRSIAGNFFKSATRNFGLPEHILDAVEQVAFVFVLALTRLEFFGGQRVGQLFEQLALFAIQLARRLHLHGGEQVS